MNRRKAVSIMAGVLALILILTLLLSILPASIFAASSSTLKQELEALKAYPTPNKTEKLNASSGGLIGIFKKDIK